MHGTRPGGSRSTCDRIRDLENPCESPPAEARCPSGRSDGTELFFVAPDNTLMSAAVNGRGPQFEVQSVRPLFQMRPRTRVRLDAYFYDVAPDGNRFLVNTVVEGQATAMPLNLVVNWTALLKK